MGWGWTEWAEWAEDACPEVCGRRCRVRRRSCSGPFVHVCQGRGRAFELEDCPALETTPAPGDEEGETPFQLSEPTVASFTRRDKLRRAKLRRRRIKP